MRGTATWATSPCSAGCLDDLVIAVPTVGFNAMFAALVGYPLPRAGWVMWVLMAR